jgi:hypothetical protein
MTYYLARAVGLGNADLKNTQVELRKKAGKSVSPAYAIAWFTQHVDDNPLTTPFPTHFLDVKRVFNDDIVFWHFFAIELDIGKWGKRKKFIRALKELGGSARSRIKGKYFKTLIPLPVTSNSKVAQDLLKGTMRKVKETGKMLTNSDAMFGMVLHTYEDSWSHAGFQMPFGHSGALYGGHGPDLPWLEPKRATEMAEQVYNKLLDYARKKYGIKEPVFQWDQIKNEVSGLMETGKEFDSPQYRKGNKATHEKDLKKRIEAWKKAILNKKRFDTSVEYLYNKDTQKDEWFGVFKKSIADVKPQKAPFLPTITNIGVAVKLIQEAYVELDKRKDRILPAKERPWLDLLRNVYEESKKIKE